MKKKISLMLCLCIMTLAMTACGADPTTVDYYGTSYSDLQENAQGLVTSMAALSDAELAETLAYYEQYKNQYAEASALANVLSSWQTVTAEVGEFEGLGGFSVDKANGTVTVDQIAAFSERDVEVSFVYEYNYTTETLEMTDAITDKVYTLGEKMEKAALNTLMGMGTVFCVLILISLIIYCFKFISLIGAPKKKETEPEAPAAPAAETVNEEPADDLELVAVISAAIAASEGTTTDSFVVRSIHRR